MRIKLLFLMAAIVNFSIAKTVTPQKAKAVAEAFFNASLAINPDLRVSSTELNLVHTESLENSFTASPAYYIFTTETSFVIVSGDDALEPILAYSFNNASINTSNSSNFKYWMNRYKKMILHSRTKEYASLRQGVSEKWNKNYYMSRKTAKTVNVSPLISTEWRQNMPYNSKCPVIGWERAVAGCGANAMAQIMKYHNYPSSGKGGWKKVGGKWYNLSRSYDWSNMPNQLTSSSSSTEVNAISNLMANAGVAAKMEYDIDISISYAPNLRDAFVNNFKYSSSAHIKIKDNMTSQQWLNACTSELDNARPFLLYGGNLAEGFGHFWVCDGYQQIFGPYFHMNWGEDIMSDGYYWVGNFAGLDDQIHGIFDIKPSSGSYYFNTEEQLVSPKISFYPNPATETIYISGAKNIKDVSCYSIQGKEIAVSLVSDKVGVAHLANGVYFLRFTNNEGEVQTHKFLKK